MKKGYITAIAVAVMSFILAVTMGVYMLVTNLNKEQKYILHVGVPSSASATIKNDVNAICKKHVEGFTVVEGSGGYTNENDSFVSQKILVYTFYDTSAESVENIAKEILEEIASSTVIMEKVGGDVVRFTALAS